MSGAPTAGLPGRLLQLSQVPGVVGGLFLDGAGAVLLCEFPASFDRAALGQLAAQLAGDGSVRRWLAEDGATMQLRFGDGHVIVRAVGTAWLVVLCTLQVNQQRLALALGPPAAAGPAGPGAAGP